MVRKTTEISCLFRRPDLAIVFDIYRKIAPKRKTKNKIGFVETAGGTCVRLISLASINLLCRSRHERIKMFLLGIFDARRFYLFSVNKKLILKTVFWAMMLFTDRIFFQFHIYI